MKKYRLLLVELTEVTDQTTKPPTVSYSSVFIERTVYEKANGERYVRVMGNRKTIFTHPGLNMPAYKIKFKRLRKAGITGAEIARAIQNRRKVNEQ
jgi:hypothetical protein